MITRFDYERRYKRRGIFIETRWFIARIYPPIWLTFTFWWK